MAETINLITKVLISLYWMVLLGNNVFLFGRMDEETRKRNKWIVALIAVNVFVIVFSALSIVI